jgi:hypothetical protein
MQTPVADGGTATDQFVVRVENAAGRCQEMTGGKVRVMYGSGQAERLEFYRQRKHGVFTLEPKVDSPQGLAMDNASNPKTLTLGNATFNQVQVIEGSAGGSCNLTPESVITICMNNCS